jgi:ATP-binding cassette, subfamily B, bacterial
VAQQIEVREPRRAARVVTVAETVEVGRDCTGIMLSDPEVSRRHLALSYTNGTLSVLDLGSSNGTSVNGVPITTETPLHPGDVVTLGEAEIVVLPPPENLDPAHISTQAMAGTDDAESPAPVEPARISAPARPALDELLARDTDAAVIRYRRGTAGERAASGYASAVRRARRRLAGLGSEPWGVRPQICLVDPFPSPDDPGALLTAGTVVDPARGEIWMVVTADSPPEPPERPLALFFGAGLPASEDVAVLVEGYGLHLARLPSPDAYLSGSDLPPLAAADGEPRALMAVSFVRHLLARGGEPAFRRLLATAQPGAVDAAALQIYGLPLSALERRWRAGLATLPPQARTVDFLRLAGGYLRRRGWWLTQLMFCTVAALAVVVVLPLALRRLIDRVLPARDLAAALQVVGVLVCALLVAGAAEIRRVHLWAKLSAAFLRQLRADMFAKLQTLSTGWYAVHDRTDVLSRLLAEVGKLQSGLRGLSDAVSQGAVLVAAGVVLAVLNLPLAATVLVGALLLAMLGRTLTRRAARDGRDVQEQVSAVVSVAAESYAAHSVVQAFALEADQRGRFRRALDHLAVQQRRAQVFESMPGVALDAASIALRLAVLALGAWLLVAGRVTVGTLVAVLTLVDQVLRPVVGLAAVAGHVNETRGAVARVTDILAAPPEVVDAPEAAKLPRPRRQIRLSAVGLDEAPDRSPLADVDAAIQVGSRVAFVGASGAGMSSVVQLLLRHCDPTTGAVHIDGQDVRHFTVTSLRGQIGAVFHDPVLFDGTLAANILLGNPGASHAAVETASRAAEAHSFVLALPHGYDTRVGERGVRLTDAQRLRITLARALLRDPAVLLLDDVTSGLDVRSERLLTATLERVSSGRTVIAATHRLTTVVDYDEIFVMDGGRIVERGPHRQLLAAGGRYAELWIEQSHAGAAEPTPFDVTAALARIPLFARLDRPGLDRVASCLYEQRVDRDEEVRSDDGRLLLVRQGRALVLTPDPAGRLITVAELGPGQAFGLGAAMGEQTDSVLRAPRPVQLLVLSAAALAVLALELPAVAAALDAAPGGAAPAGGARLSRVALRPSLSADPVHG